MIYTLNSGFMKYEINALGAELQSAKTKDGFEYIWQGGNIWNGHSPILFPICGRLKDNKYTYNGKEYSLGCHGFYSKSTPDVVDYNEKKEKIYVQKSFFSAYTKEDSYGFSSSSKYVGYN